jgi:hypothetical protein
MTWLEILRGIVFVESNGYRWVNTDRKIDVALRGMKNEIIYLMVSIICLIVDCN